MLSLVAILSKPFCNCVFKSVCANSRVGKRAASNKVSIRNCILFMIVIAKAVNVLLQRSVYLQYSIYIPDALVIVDFWWVIAVFI